MARGGLPVGPEYRRHPTRTDGPGSELGVFRGLFPNEALGLEQRVGDLLLSAGHRTIQSGYLQNRSDPARGIVFLRYFLGVSVVMWLFFILFCCGVVWCGVVWCGYG